MSEFNLSISLPSPLLYYNTFENTVEDFGQTSIVSLVV